MELEQDRIRIKKGTLLPLMEAFYTLQGEGYHKGSAAFFIRIGGCDVGCHWCDVKESWDANLHPPTPIEHTGTPRPARRNRRRGDGRAGRLNRAPKTPCQALMASP